MLESNNSAKNESSQVDSSNETLLKLILAIQERLEVISRRLDDADLEPSVDISSSVGSSFLKKTKNHVIKVIRSHFENETTGAIADLRRASPEILHLRLFYLLLLLLPFFL